MQNLDKILKERIQEQLAPAQIIEVTSEEAEDPAYQGGFRSRK